MADDPEVLTPRPMTDTDWYERGETLEETIEAADGERAGAPTWLKVIATVVAAFVFVLAAKSCGINIGGNSAPAPAPAPSVVLVTPGVAVQIYQDPAEAAPSMAATSVPSPAAAATSTPKVATP